MSQKRSPLALLLVVACASEPETVRDAGSAAPDTGSADAGAGAAPDATPDAALLDVTPHPLTVAWEPCDLRVTVDGTTECATVEAPRHWDRPEAGSLQISVKRFRPSNARGQLWVLVGGPGIAGDHLQELLPYINRSIVRDLDLYLLDYRGTGPDDQFSCPEQQSGLSPGGAIITTNEWTDCIAGTIESWDGDLSIFSTENVARDLGGLVSATRAPSEQVFIYGISYGTSLAQWYLALFPDQADGVVLEAVLPRGAAAFPSPYAASHDRVGQEYLGHCAADASCSAALGNDAWARLGELQDLLDNGHCAALQGLDGNRLRSLLAVLLQGYETRKLIPAIIHRLLRCSTDDVTALSRLLRVYQAEEPGASSGAGPLDSDLLKYFIIATEFFESPTPTPADYQQTLDSLRIAPPGGLAMVLAQERFLASSSAAITPLNTDVPVLIMNGTMDPQTPAEQAIRLKEELTAPHQHLVLFEGIPHDVFYSFTTNPREQPCAVQILKRFLQRPRAQLNTSCTERLIPIDFAPEPSLVSQLFGTTDLWGN